MTAMSKSVANVASIVVFARKAAMPMSFTV
jgi:hypothetical protein